MYLYDDLDRALVKERVAEFRDQVARRLSGALTEDEFKPLAPDERRVPATSRLHAARRACPTARCRRRRCARSPASARRYDRGYGHFTTRQNIQFNWIKLEELPDAMAELAEAGLHGIQTSGNCVRNITTDQWAGVAPGEIDDPRVWAEILRQHSVAASGIFVPAAQVQDRRHRLIDTTAPPFRCTISACALRRNEAGELGFEVMVGGGLGRTPFLAKSIKPFLPARDLLSYVEAILRVYNQFARRDNIYKARIKILVHDLGAEAFAREVDAEWQAIKDGPLALDAARRRRHPRALSLSCVRTPRGRSRRRWRARATAMPRFDAWLDNAVARAQGAGPRHRHAVAEARRRPAGRRDRGPDGCASPTPPTVTASAKSASATTRTWCCRTWHSAICFRCGERSTPSACATPNVGLASDIIACPGLDYCSLANARSIPVAQELTRRFRDATRRDLGRLHINISGCINACGHHHVGHIGLLGVEKNGEEFYQITIGGRADEQRAPGRHHRARRAVCRRRRCGRAHRRCLSRIARRARRTLRRHREAVWASNPSGSASMPLIEERPHRRRPPSSPWPTAKPCPTACRCCCPQRGFWPMPMSFARHAAPIGVIWPNDRRVAELAPYLGQLCADRAFVSEISRRPRLQPGAAIARAIRVHGHAARHRRRVARPVPVHAARGFRLA